MRILNVRRLAFFLFFFACLFFIFGKNSIAHAELSSLLPAPTYQGWNLYTMGYRFTPTVNGNVTQLKCYNVQSQTARTTVTVTLWTDTGTMLAQANVTCTTGWGSYDLPSPVPVTAGTYYRVAVSPSNYYQSLSSVPVTTGNIIIDSGWYNTSGTLNSFPGPTAGGTIFNSGAGMYGVPDVTVTASAGNLDNGAGGSYTCSGCTNQQHALAACQSKYGGNCVVGSCGSFSYYYNSPDGSCTCGKSIGSYEWIYNNTGYTTVGADYGGQATDVTGDSLFVRKKNTSVCDSNSWVLALKDLGTATPGGGGNTTATFNYTGGMQNWMVPAGVTSVTLEAWGAKGGNTEGGAYSGGLGAYVKGTFSVTAGQILKILVGKQGTTSGSPSCLTNGDAGGGGGSFVTDNSNNPMAIAGGGGGGSGSSAGLPGNSGTSGTQGVGGGGAGGTSGNGGGSQSFASAGGGFYSDGGVSTSYPCAGNGKSFQNGGAGATASCNTSGGNNPSGGYGGGGGGHGYCCIGGGGGGGYSGGGGGYSCQGGGGGGSYLSPSSTNQILSGGLSTGDGKVVVTYTAASTSTLTVTNPGATGTITDGITPNINCPTVNCSYAYTNGTSITLYTTPAIGYTFSSWTAGPCAGSTSSTCTFTINSAQTVTANFVVSAPTSVTTTAVSAIISGGASENQAKLNGTVNPNGFATTGWFRYQANTSPGTCNDTFGTRLPASGEVTVGSGSTSISIPTQTTLATLTPNTLYYYCAIAKGNGVTVPASNVLSFTTAPVPPTGITPSTTTAPGIRNITWNASTGADRYYIRIDDAVDGWAPPVCDNGTAPNSGDVCQYTSATSYSYNFLAGHTYNIWIHSYNTSVPTTSNSTNVTVTVAYPLNVSKNLGAGSSASVTSLDGFINCGATCSYSYTTNASVKLTAVPDGVTRLTGWSGVICTGAGESQTTTTCTFNVGSITGLNNTVTANFTKITYLLTVAKNGGAAGLGSGTVQSTVSGTPDNLINCGATCTHTYDINTQVTLKETPDTTATFAGWSGASCLEGNQTSTTCTVLMDAAKTVTANFNSVGYTGDATFYFGSPGQTCNPNNGSKTTPALEVVVISGSTSSPTVSKYFFDPCNRVNGSTGLVTALNSTTGLYQGVTFAYKGTVPAITHGLIMKVVPLYNSSIVGVQGTDIFPPQGKVIQSTGNSGDTARKVIYYESYPQIPNEIFPYSILSQ